MLKRIGLVSILIALMAIPAVGEINDKWAIETETGTTIIRIPSAGTSMRPGTDDAFDLGHADYEFKDMYSDGVIYCDSISLNGVVKTSWGGVVSPFEDDGTYITPTSAPTKFIFTISSGDLDCTQFTTDSYYGSTGGQLIDMSTNNEIVLGDNSDTLSITFDGTDVILEPSDGAFVVYSGQADGEVHFKTAADLDDYLIFDTASGISQIKTASGGDDGDLSITAEGGEIDFDDENLSTSGTLGCGALTATSIGGVDQIVGSTNSDEISFLVDDTITVSSDDEHMTFRVLGYTSKDSIITMAADLSADNGDDWQLKSATSGNAFTIANDTSGSQVAKLTLATTGRMTLGGDRITLDEGEYISNADDDHLKMGSNDSAMVVEVWANVAAGDATLQLSANQDLGFQDQWQVQADATTKSLFLKNDWQTADTFVTRFTLTATGDVTVAGDVDIDGNDLTAAGDLVVTPGGGDVDFSVANIFVDSGKMVAVDGSTKTNYIMLDTGNVSIAATADINLQPAGGDVDISGADLWLDIGKKLSLDSISETNYIVVDTGSVSIASTADLKFQVGGGDVDVSGADVWLDSGKKLSLNSLTETNYLMLEGSGNVSLASTADICFQSGGGQVEVSGADVAVDSGKKFGFNGIHALTNDFIYLSTDVTLDATADIWVDAGGGDVIVDNADLRVDTGKKLSVDGALETSYIMLDTGNVSIASTGDIGLQPVGADVDITGADLWLDSGKMLSLDSATETNYLMVEGSGNVSLAGTADICFTAGGGQVEVNAADLAVDSGKKIGLNGIHSLTADFVYLSTDVTLDATADIWLNAGGADVRMPAADLLVDTGQKLVIDGQAETNYIMVDTGNVSIAATADINLQPAGGDVDISAADVWLDTSKKLSFNSSSETDVIYSSTDLQIAAAADVVVSPTGGDVDINAANLAVDAGSSIGLAGIASITEASMIYYSDALEFYINGTNVVSIDSTGVITQLQNQKVVSTHETNAQAVERGTETLSGGTVQVTFGTAFASAPVIVAMYTEAVTDDCALYATWTSTTTCDITTNGAATEAAYSGGIGWIAIGDAE